MCTLIRKHTHMHSSYWPATYLGPLVQSRIFCAFYVFIYPQFDCLGLSICVVLCILSRLCSLYLSVPVQVIAWRSSPKWRVIWCVSHLLFWAYNWVQQEVIMKHYSGGWIQCHSLFVLTRVTVSPTSERGSKHVWCVTLKQVLVWWNADELLSLAAERS